MRNGCCFVNVLGEDCCSQSISGLICPLNGFIDVTEFKYLLHRAKYLSEYEIRGGLLYVTLHSGHNLHIPKTRSELNLVSVKDEADWNIILVSFSTAAELNYRVLQKFVDTLF